MKDRLKLLRHKLAVTQSEFGKSIGRSLISIQQYEAGTRKLDESMLLLIEKTFNVNPSWLREGVGEMFTVELAPALPQIDPSLPKDIQKIMKQALRLKPEYAKNVLEYIDYQLDLQSKAVFGDATAEDRKDVV